MWYELHLEILSIKLGYSEVQHHSRTVYTCWEVEYILLVSATSACKRKRQPLLPSLSLEANWHSLEVEYIYILTFFPFFFLFYL